MSSIQKIDNICAVADPEISKRGEGAPEER
jgi:hypothetical protein